MDKGSLLGLFTLLQCLDMALACGGAVAGSILGTIAVCCIVFAILFFCLLKRGFIKRVNKKDKAQASSGDQSYVNPGFQQDEHITISAPTNIHGAERGFGGYIPCQEYESPNKNRNYALKPVNGDFHQKSWTPNFRGGGGGGRGHYAMSKTGSRGSLDDTYATNDPEIVSVSLQSQDIIGLGFNICGSMRDGIFVSQVHNRGPASETGKIKPGDRILDITISFENMVFEDALTILSYASPYPVRLHIQKSMPEKTAETQEDADADDTVHHPVYRSQSMDDVSKIQRERFSFRMRRARSEMKRGSSKNKNEEAGTLSRWRAKQDMLGYTPGSGGTRTAEERTDQKSLNSNFSIPDMDIDTADLMADIKTQHHEQTHATVHGDYETDGQPRVLAVDIPNGSYDKSSNDIDIERLRAEIQQEFNAAPEEMVGKVKAAPVAAAAPGYNIETRADVEDVKINLFRNDSTSNHSDKSNQSSEFDDVGNEIDNDFLMRALKLSEPDAQLVPDVGTEIIVSSRVESGIEASPSASHSQVSVQSSQFSELNLSKSSTIDIDESEYKDLKFTTTTESNDGEDMMIKDVQLPQNSIPDVHLDTEKEDATDAAAAEEVKPAGDQQVEVASNDEYVVVDMANNTKLKDSLESSFLASEENVPDASMIVNFSEQSLLMKDDPDVPVESAEGEDPNPEGKTSVTSDEEEMRILKDYLGDRPFLMDKIMDSDDESAVVIPDSAVQKTVTTVTSVSSSADGGLTESTVTTSETLVSSDWDTTFQTTTTSSSVESQGDHSDQPDLSELKSIALSEAKREIRRRSHSEEEKRKSSASSRSSSSSSRSSSAHSDDLDMDLSLIRQKLTMADISMDATTESSVHSDDEDGAKKSQSPDIKKRSSGGLSYEITSQEFQSMPDEIALEPRGEPKGGMTYFVGIDDELRGAKVEGDQLDPVRAWESTPIKITGDRRASTASTASIHSDDYEPGKLHFKVPGSAYIEGNNNELPNAEMKNASIDLNFNGRNSSLESTPIGSPIKKGSDILTKPERFTLNTHDEAKGAYTMTVNSLDVDDSEA